MEQELEMYKSQEVNKSENLNRSADVESVLDNKIMILSDPCEPKLGE